MKMRLQVSFVTLLILATMATSLVWRESSPAEHGDLLAEFVVSVFAPVALLAMALLGRIVLKVRR
jgi:hypothetical protein